MGGLVLGKSTPSVRYPLELPEERCGGQDEDTHPGVAECVSMCPYFSTLTAFVLLAMSIPDTRITRAELSKFLRMSSSLITSVAHNRFKTNIDDVRLWQQRFHQLRNMYALEESGASVVGKWWHAYWSLPCALSFTASSDLPKCLCAAISALRTDPPGETELAELVQHLTYIADIDPSQESEDVEADEPQTSLKEIVAKMDGKSGAETWEAMDDPSLRLRVFGIPHGGHVSGLNTHLAVHPDVVGLQPQSVEWQTALQKEPAKFTELQMDRVQWNGAAALLSAAFDGRPVLITDEVGIGKTGQMLFTFMWIAHFRPYQMQFGRFPGQVHTAAKVWPQHPSLEMLGRVPALPQNVQDPALCNYAPVIPDVPFIIAVPHTLQNQWMEEAHKFIDQNALTALPYPSMSIEARAHFWHTIFPAAVQRVTAGRIVIIASYPVRTPRV
jgi:hypothetical protein